MNVESRMKERIVHLIGDRVDDYFPQLEATSSKPYLFYAGQNFLGSLSFFQSKHKTYRLIIKAGENVREVFVKIRENDVSAQKEYKDTLNCWKGFSSEDFSVSRPLDVLPEINAIVFEKADGTSLQSLLNRALLFGKYRFSGTYLTEYFTRAGKWLRTFHRTFSTQKSVDIEIVLSQIENWLQGSSAKLGENSKEMICRVARNKAEENRLKDIGTSLLHGNFVPAHVFVHGQKVTLIDFERLRYGPVYIDLLSFALSLDLMLKIFNSQVPRLKRAFFSGYFGDEQIPESTMQLFKIHRLAIKLYVPVGLQKSLAHRLHSRMLVNRAKALLAETAYNSTSNFSR